jgi:2-keto-4-pentenoate hydratase
MTPADWNDPKVRDGIRRMLALRDERIAAGARAIGWKLAFGAPASLARFGLAAPLLGFLTDATVHAPGSAVSCAGWEHPVAEPEIAVYLGEDVAPDGSNVVEAISGLGAAIELANVHPPSEDIEEILAGNIFHEAVLFGAQDRSRAGAMREGLRGRVLHDGAEITDTEDLEAITGDLVEIVAHAAALLGLAGAGLSAGDVVIAGSIVPPLRIAPGEEIVFELAPLRPISVRV